MVMTLSPLATSADLQEFGSNMELLQNTTRWTTPVLDRLMLRATRAVEGKCRRRLAPFSAKVESHRAQGIAPDEYGGQPAMPMDLTGAVGWSQAAAMGVSNMVREFWLDEYPPEYQELWAYNLESVEIERTFSDSQTFTGPDFVSWQGPEPDTGHVKMPIGTYCPTGSTIRVTYGGGYQTVPDDLNLATVMQAMKFVIVGAEPETRQGMSTAELDTEMALLLAPFERP